jgi:hypothetical protein
MFMMKLLANMSRLSLVFHVSLTLSLPAEWVVKDISFSPPIQLMCLCHVADQKEAAIDWKTYLNKSCVAIPATAAVAADNGQTDFKVNACVSSMKMCGMINNLGLSSK